MRAKLTRETSIQNRRMKELEPEDAMKKSGGLLAKVIKLLKANEDSEGSMPIQNDALLSLGISRTCQRAMKEWS
jgi:hypothetical protein